MVGNSNLNPSVSGSIWAAIKDGLAPGLAVVPVSLAYGVIAYATGLTLGQTMTMTALVAAGASQLVTLNLITLGASLSQIFITTALINFRFSLLSVALSRFLRNTSKAWFPILAFTLITPTFPLVMTRGEKYGRVEIYMLTIQTEFLIFGILGSLVGYLVPGLLTPDLVKALTFAFPALLIGMVISMIPATKRSISCIVCFTAGLLGVLFYFVSDVWSIVMAAVVGGAIGTIMEWKWKQQ